MRKFTLLLIVFIFAAHQGFSQYFMVKLGGGYSWPGVQQGTGALTFQPGSSTDPAYASIIPLASFSTAKSDSSSAKYRKNLYAGYGQGGHFDLSFGYMITPYFGVELDGAALWGSTVTATQFYDASYILGNNTTIITKTHSNGVSVNPSLVFRAAKSSSKFAPYARVGLALPIAGALYHNLSIHAPNSPLAADPTTSTFSGPADANIGVKTEANLSLGIQGCAGVSYTPFPLMTFWGEVNGQYLFVKAKESTLTSYTLALNNGPAQNLLPTFSKYSQVINYVDQLTNSSNTEYDASTGVGKTRNPSKSGQAGYVNENQAHDELRQVANLGAFGFTVGVTFNMSKKIFKDPFGKKAKKAAADGTVVK